MLRVAVQNNYSQTTSALQLTAAAIVSLPVSDYISFTPKGLNNSFRYRLTSASPWQSIQVNQPSGMLVGTGPVQIQSDFAAQADVISYLYIETTDDTGKSVAFSGSVTAVQRVAETTAIPLDTAGNGKAMPLVAGDTISISADYIPTIAAGAVLNGVCVADYTSSGAGNLLLTNYNPRGDTFAAELGRKFTVTYYKQVSGAYAVVQKGDLMPRLISAIVASTTPGRIDLTWNKSINATVSAVSAFAVSAGHPLTAHTYVDATHSYLTTSTNFVNAEVRTLSYTQPGTNNMQDLAGNLVANIIAAVITDNVPAAPTFISQNAPAGTVGTAYTYTFSALNTTSYAVFSGTLPAGLTLNTATGVLSGTPTTAATSTFVISATGAGGTTNSTLQSVAIVGSLVLDSIATAALGAYSLTRKLRAAYAGSAAVIRSSAGGNITVGFSGNSVDWTTAMTTLGANDAYLVTLYDQSGNAYHTTQATTGQQPKIATAGVLNKQASTYAAALSNGTNSGLVSSSITLAATLSGLTIFGAAGLATNTGTCRLAAFKTAADANDFSSNASLFISTSSANVQASAGANSGSYEPFTSGATQVVCARYATAGASEIWENGVAGTAGAIGGGIPAIGTAGAGNLISFQTGLQPGAAQPVAGNAMEIIYFPAKLSDADRLAVESNMRTAYGV